MGWSILGGSWRVEREIGCCAGFFSDKEHVRLLMELPKNRWISEDVVSCERCGEGLGPAPEAVDGAGKSSIHDGVSVCGDIWKTPAWLGDSLEDPAHGQGVKSAQPIWEGAGGLRVVRCGREVLVQESGYSGI